jgi:glycine/D-amino acid oxidase-like deaminating enzyme
VAITAGIVVAHAEGGSGIAMSPAITYLISEIGVMFL